MKIESNKSLKTFNTFNVDVKTQKLLILQNSEDFTSEQLKDAVKEKFIILGEGSNTLFVNDFNGNVIVVRNKGIRILDDNEKAVTVNVNAGENWNDFVYWNIKNNLIGLQNLVDIPGNTGSSPIQNIGAYGTEVKSYIKSINYINLDTFKLEEIDNKKCDFGYRDSIFKKELKDKALIKDITFVLERYKDVVDDKYLTYSGIQEKLKGKDITLNSVLESVKELRAEKLPSIKEYGSCGSVFKNIELTEDEYIKLERKFPDLPRYDTEKKGIFKIPVAYILEKLRWKNKRTGKVGTWIHHPLVVVNYGGASGKEIYDFILTMQKDFKKNTSFDLDTEINIIN